MIVRRGEEPIEEEFVTVLPGESVSAIVNLGDNYEFKSVGKYVVKVNLPLNSQLMYAPDDTQIAAFFIDALPIRKTVGAPLAYTNCLSSEINQCESAVSGSINECSRAVYCLNGGCDTLYARWFGTYSDSNWNYVQTSTETYTADYTTTILMVTVILLDVVTMFMDMFIPLIRLTLSTCVVCSGLYPVKE